MKQRWLNFATAVWLTLIVVLIALWVRSYWVADVLVLFQRDGSMYVLLSGQGGLFVGHHTNASSDRRLYSARYDPDARIFFQFPISARSTKLFGAQRWVGVAHYVPLVILTVSGFVLWRARRRRSPGRCQNCGYDLRASPDRYPECGEVAPGSAARRIPLTPSRSAR